MIAAAIAALVVSLKYYRRHKELRAFPWYILFSLMEDGADFYRYAKNQAPGARIVAGIAGNAFMLFEFILCTCFILLHVSSVLRRRAIKVNAMIYLLFLAFFCIRKPVLLTVAIWYFFESLFLVLPCLVYFYELFLDVHLQPLTDKPAFWIITGILFLNCCAIPLFLTAGALGKYNEAAFSLNYILYALFFSLLIRAYLCQPAGVPIPADSQIRTG